MSLDPVAIKLLDILRRQEPVKILIIEDEPNTNEYLRQGLREPGYVVDLARDQVEDRVEGLELGADDCL